MSCDCGNCGPQCRVLHPITEALCMKGEDHDGLHEDYWFNTWKESYLVR